MANAMDTALLKFHKSFNVSDLSRTVAFYYAISRRRAYEGRGELGQVRRGRTALRALPDS